MAACDEESSGQHILLPLFLQQSCAQLFKPTLLLNRFLPAGQTGYGNGIKDCFDNDMVWLWTAMSVYVACHSLYRSACACIAPCLLLCLSIIVHWTGGQGMLGEDRNTRASLTQAASVSPGADPLGPALDYLISCAYTSTSNQLMLLAGNNQGAVGCFPVVEPSSPGGVCSFGAPRALLSGAHDSVSAALHSKLLLLARVVFILHDISVDDNLDRRFLG